jgi:hypothetical protein
MNHEKSSSFINARVIPESRKTFDLLIKTFCLMEKYLFPTYNFYELLSLLLNYSIICYPTFSTAVNRFSSYLHIAQYYYGATAFLFIKYVHILTWIT